jgi:membrane associated rhomboid family serine protease
VKRVKAIFRTASESAQISCVLVGIIFIVFLLNAMVQGRLNAFGIYPRTTAGLIGILCSPFLHATPAHLTANCSALLILLFILFLNRKYCAEETLLWIWFGSGFGTWLIGRSHTASGQPNVHIGASSIIYGLIVYLIAAGFWMKGWKPVVAGIIVFVLYGAAIYGVVPQSGPISWEGHLSGAITGFLVARKQHA